MSNSASISSLGSSKSRVAVPILADANTNGESSADSSAPSSTNRSSISSIISSGLASGLSTLLMVTTTDKFNSNAFFNTNFVCGIGPSKASTNSTTPSTILSTRSTSPPKSA